MKGDESRYDSPNSTDVPNRCLSQSNILVVSSLELRTLVLKKKIRDPQLIQKDQSLVIRFSDSRKKNFFGPSRKNLRITISIMKVIFNFFFSYSCTF